MLITNALAISIYRAIRVSWTPASFFASLFSGGYTGFLGVPFVANTTTVGAGVSEITNQIAASPDYTQGTAGAQPALSVYPFCGVTQLFTYSDDFSNAAWVPVAASKSGRTFTVDGTTATHPVYQSQTIISGRSYTYSIDFESTAYQYAGLALNSAGVFGNTTICYFRLTDSTVFVQPAYYTSATITQVSTNRWRLRVTGPSTGAGSTTGIRVYPAVSTDGGATATANFNGTTYPGSYTLYKAQFQFGASETTYQESTTANDISQTGQLPVYLPRGAGDDFLSLGTGSFGTATSGLFANTGQNWSTLLIFRTLADGTIQAQRGATDASAMFSARVATNTLRVLLRGTDNNTSITVTDGKLHYASIVCTNGVVTCAVDLNARQTLTVGAAAAETQNITLMARTESAPANYLTGRAHNPILEDRAWTAAEEATIIRAAMSTFGGLNA